MSRRYWGNGFATGLILGGSLATLLLLLLQSSQPYSYASDEPSHQPSGENGGGQARDDEQGNIWWHWDGGLVSSRDTLAQWIMMAFTVVAAGLLLGTLSMTRKLACDTREIGDMQNRPWLKCRLEFPSGLLAAQGSLPFGMRLDITNIGKSPATDVLADVFLFQSLGHDDEALIEGLRRDLVAKIETGHERAGAILPGETFHRMRAEALRINMTDVLPFLGGVEPAACVVAVYKIPSDGEWHCTATVFDIFVKDAGGVGLGHHFPLDGRAIPGEGLNVVMRRNAIAT